MDITTTQTTSFRIGLLDAEFDFSSDTAQTFKIALFDSNATLDATVTAYSTTNEVVGTGYSAGGATLTIATNPTSSGTVAYLDFDDVTWSATSLTARGALIYKADGVTDPSVATIDFGENKTTSTANFVIQFPTADSASAIIRIA